jgi:heterodisulfide reductase subunit A-like polyferredoxin
MGRIGLVLCTCDPEGISRFDPELLADGWKGRKDVLTLAHCPPACSESGMKAIRAFVERNDLDRMLVACSKPELFGRTLKKTLRQWGLDPSLSEVLAIPLASEGQDLQEASKLLSNAIEEMQGRAPSKRREIASHPSVVACSSSPRPFRHWIVPSVR